MDENLWRGVNLSPHSINPYDKKLTSSSEQRQRGLKALALDKNELALAERILEICSYQKMGKSIRAEYRDRTEPAGVRYVSVSSQIIQHSGKNCYRLQAGQIPRQDSARVLPFAARYVSVGS